MRKLNHQREETTINKTGSHTLNSNPLTLHCVWDFKQLTLVVVLQKKKKKKSVALYHKAIPLHEMGEMKLYAILKSLFCMPKEHEFGVKDKMLSTKSVSTPNSILKPNPQYDGIRRQGLWRTWGWNPQEGDQWPYKRGLRNLPCPFPCEDDVRRCQIF